MTNENAKNYVSVHTLDSGDAQFVAKMRAMAAQVSQLVEAYLGDADPMAKLASPLGGALAGLPPVRVHVGDDEVLLDDSRRYFAEAFAADVNAKLDIWMGMPHGFVTRVGTLKAADQAMDEVGAFLAEMLGIARDSK